MSQERDQAQQHAVDANQSVNADVAPGKSSTSAQLTAPANPVVSPLLRKILRKGRDDNGVADHAESAVAAAGSSSGSALPEPLQRKFEGSLGTDLSSVRVHTGDQSQTANDAVGARAYAVGQDIHFGAGQFDPSSAGGQHLIAHEVAHTVQQRGGTPGRQNKLEVSAPGDALESEADRAADAMVTGAPASVTGASGVSRQMIQRGYPTDKDKTPEKFPGKPPTDFDPNQLPPEVLDVIDNLSIDSLRAITMTTVTAAKSNYLQACNDVKVNLAARIKKEEEDKKEMRDLGITIAGLFLGGVAGAAAGRLAGPALQTKLTEVVGQSAPAKLLKLGLEKETAQKLTEPFLKQLASERVTALLAKAGKKEVEGWLGSGAEKAAKAALKVDVNGSPASKALSYVDALLLSAGGDADQLNEKVGTCKDAATLVAAHSKFGSTTISVYRADIQTRADNFASQVGSTVGSNKTDQIVTINAYGKARLATVHYNGDSANYRFVSWITPDMEPTVRLLNPNPMTIPGSAVTGHLPEPKMEGAQYGQEQIMKTNAWGRERLLVVKTDKGFVSTSYGTLVFVRWVAKDEEEESAVKGGMQMQGIPYVDVGKVENLKQPAD